MNSETKMPTIVIAEDSNTQARRLEHLLALHNFRVELARDGREAFDLILAQMPVLVVTDILMPEIDGFELCRKIKNDLGLAHIPVVLLTSLTSSDDVLKGLECGADSFITKPYSENYLIDHIHRILEQTKVRKKRAMIELTHAGADATHTLKIDPQRMLSLLISTYEAAIIKNKELLITRDTLMEMKDRLEELVIERTVELNTINDELEQRVEERTRELRMANQELEAFAHTVSHDLRSPLRSIDGFTALLLDPDSNIDDAGKRRYGRMITESVRRMTRLIDDLLAFSHVSHGDMKAGHADMKDIVQSVIEEFESQGAIARHKFRIGDLPSIHGDAAMLRQVWTNLISNAVKFSSRAGEPVITITVKDEDGSHLFSVHDNGVGFDMKSADQLFTIFRRLHDQGDFEGSGIGLAIVQRIVQRHGGTVRAESTQGAGATFYFTLPKADSGGTPDGMRVPTRA